MQNILVDQSCERADQIRNSGEIIRYGTTGLRFGGEDVIAVSYRCGIVLGLLSKAYHPHCIGKTQISFVTTHTNSIRNHYYCKPQPDQGQWL